MFRWFYGTFAFISVTSRKPSGFPLSRFAARYALDITILYSIILYNPIWDYIFACNYLFSYTIGNIKRVCFLDFIKKEYHMDNETLKLLEDINHAVIKFRGVYSAWSKKHGISYNEMLVLYTIRDNDFCTQKQICDSYLLPRQTINHVIAEMRKNGLLGISPENCIGREKAFVLTEKGISYAAPLLDSLNKIEKQAIEIMGYENMRSMAEAVMTYDKALNKAMEENK